MPRNTVRRGGYLSSPHRAARKFNAGRNLQRNLLLGTGSPIGFTLADEARSTAHGGSVWSQDSRLRSRPVSFVSAGAVDPLKQLEEQLQRRAQEALGHLSGAVSSGDSNEAVDAADARANRGLNFAQSATTLATKVNSAAISPVGKAFDDECSIPIEPGQSSAHELSHPNPPSSDSSTPRLFDSINAQRIEPVDEADQRPRSPIFFYDTVGDTSRFQLEEHTVSTQSEQPAHSESESSEDVILFKGRNRTRNQAPNQTRSPHSSRKAVAFDLREIRQEIQAVDESTISATVHDDGLPTLNHGPAPRAPTRAQRKREKNEKKRNKKNRKVGQGGQNSVHTHNICEIEDEEEASVADYIANMQQEYDGIGATTGHIPRDLGGVDMAVDIGDGSFGTGWSFEPSHDADAPDSPSSQKKARTLAQADNGAVEQDPSKEDQKVLDPLGEAQETDWETSLARGFDLDDYDFMDWSGPLTGRRRKSKGLPLNLNLSDSDLEAQMLETFESSRLKKAEKRKEREVLREQGLLGSKVKTDDLRVKYQKGMNLDEIANELRAFLLGNQTSLTLPPMDNQARKVIHELANKFNIKSKSTGAGDQRRPTLHRTVRTFKYTEEAFDAAIARVGRKYFPRRDRVSVPGAQRQSRGQGGSRALSYRDGEIVGGSAPELGEGNRGRLMLEKMGWSTGTALGATTNKGILTPVEQKVKRGKAGLG